MRDIIEFSRELIESEFATINSIIGCKSVEVAQIFATAPENFNIPDEYQAFLEVMGKKAGTLFRGTDLFYPGMLETLEAAADISAGALPLEDRFFVGHHQGYKVYFFKRGSESIYSYQEGEPGETQLADGFIAFLRQALRLHQEIRASTDAIHNRMRNRENPT